MTANKLRISLLLAAIIAIVLLAVAWADKTSTSTGRPTHASGTWTPGGTLPGVRLTNSTLTARGQAGVQAAVRISHGIDAQSIREVISGDVVGLGLRLITARGPGGTPCVSFITEAGGARQFSCLDSANGDALVRFAASGGSTVNKTDWTTLVGLARSDVSRVTLVTQDGSERTLELNRWRGFAYSAGEPGAFPASLRAYSEAGLVIDEVPTLP
jgi:hypothetical protein